MCIGQQDDEMLVGTTSSFQQQYNNFPCSLSTSDHGIVIIIVSMSLGAGILSLLFVRYLYVKVTNLHLICS